MDDRIRPNKDQSRAAHAEYDKTRCSGWLAATGNRPVGGIKQVSLLKAAVPVERAARAMPAFACDVHPVEP